MGRTKDPAAVPALINTLKDSYEGVREAAAWALGKIGPEAKTATPALIEALKDIEESVRSNAARALGNMERVYSQSLDLSLKI